MIDSFKVNLSPFNSERTIRVYLPSNYHSSHQRYPVLYMHDGQYLFRDEDSKRGGSWEIEDFLDSNGYEVIVVGIDCASGLLRIEEYGPWENDFIRERIDGVKGPVGGQGQPYVDYIVNELKPKIDERYRTLKDNTGMAGSSMGGLITLYAACKFPSIFTKIACMSSAFWFNEEELKQCIQSSDLHLIEKVYVDIGTNEDTGRMSSEAYLQCNKWVHSLLTNKVSNLKFNVIEDGDHTGKAWGERFPAIIEFLYGNE